jgi:hypothetical protein
MKTVDGGDARMAHCLEWTTICTREGRVVCVAPRQGWIVATRWDDVMRELWAEEMLGWHSVWSPRLFVPARIGWCA